MATSARRLAWAAIVGQLIFVGGWLVIGALEGHGYSAARHDVSDLGALTAHYPGAMLAIEGVSGVLTMAFAVWALRPALAVGAWLVAVSLPALDNLGDVFFRLDCRAADAGCSASQATASWHGKMHIAVFLIAAIPTVIAPFVLSRRMAAVEGWRDLAGRTKAFGFVLIGGIILTVATTDTAVQGLTQRVVILLVCGAVAVLAARILTLAPDRA